jgi:pimeloyl-ACP methyl ester carboxylesterase
VPWQPEAEDTKSGSLAADVDETEVPTMNGELIARRHTREGPAGRRRWVEGRGPIILAAAAAALAGTAIAVNWQARRTEQKYPPVGNFVTVNGVRLHYVEAGEGPPIVLLHGNASMLNDLALSIVRPLSERHRVIAFDRPGFGYSDRPKSRVWTPEVQAALFHDAFRALGIDRPVVYGHSFGAVVTMAFALMYPAETRGVVLASGYYYPTRRLDSRDRLDELPAGHRHDPAQHPDAAGRRRARQVGGSLPVRSGADPAGLRVVPGGPRAAAGTTPRSLRGWHHAARLGEAD